MLDRLGWVWRNHKGATAVFLGLAVILSFVLIEMAISAFVGWANSLLASLMEPVFPSFVRVVVENALGITAALALVGLAAAGGFILGERYRPVSDVKPDHLKPSPDAIKDKIAEWLAARNEVERIRKKFPNAANVGHRAAFARAYSGNPKRRLREAAEEAMRLQVGRPEELRWWESDNPQYVADATEELLSASRELARQHGVDPEEVAPLPEED